MHTETAYYLGTTAAKRIDEALTDVDFYRKVLETDDFENYRVLVNHLSKMLTRYRKIVEENRDGTPVDLVARYLMLMEPRNELK
jgi:hypothetical protein